MTKEEKIFIRIHKEDKKMFQDYANEKGRTVSELLLDFIKLTLVEWDKSKN